jgi:thymidylate synthase (FAD)
LKIVPQSVELIDSMGSDLSVVNAARVSFAKESEWQLKEDNQGWVDEVLSEQDQKLIKYLATHNHWSPFAHAFLSFRIKAPIFVARQLVKHQVGLSWNEVSRRYVDDEPEFYMPAVFHARPDASIKQGSGKVHFLSDQVYDAIAGQAGDALYVYKTLINDGVAPEEARMVLPLNTMTEWVWSGSLMAFARVCKQRLDSHAQGATQEVAQKINELVPSEFTHSWKALVDTAN